MAGEERLRDQEQKLERLSPFQLKDRLINLAREDHERSSVGSGLEL